MAVSLKMLIVCTTSMVLTLVGHLLLDLAF
jgi:hypothetical protein